MKNLLFLLLFLPSLASAQIISPNMGLPVPIPGVTTGPDYATDINSSLAIIDSHNHAPGSGVQVTPLGLNINQDLSCQSNNLTNVKTVNFTAQLVPLTGASPNLGAVYVVGNELYYNDEVGNQVAITHNGNVNSGAGSITGLPSGTASASYSVGTFTWQSATNTAANMDAGSYILRNLVASSKGLTLSPPNSMAADYGLVLPSLPSQDRVLTLDTSGNITPSATSGTGTTQADVLPGLGLIPTGSIIAFGGTSAPAGYLLCDGSSVLRASYPTLFTAIGTAYGAADGTHFNLPDLRGEFPRGVSGSSTNDPDKTSRTTCNTGGATGNNVGSCQSYEIQSHTHNITDPGHSHFFSDKGNFSAALGPPYLEDFNASGFASTISSSSSTTGVTVNADGGNETRPINVYVNYIIKL